MPDLGVFNRYKNFNDYQGEADKASLANALAAAQIAAVQQKNQFLDVDKLGEQSLFKAAQGIPLSPAETAAAKFASAKSGGVQFDPVSGSMIQKPNLASSLGLDLGGGTTTNPNASPSAAPMRMPKTGEGFTSGLPTPELDLSNPFDQEFKAQFDAQSGNPKAQQSLLENFSKAKFTPNEEQSKNAAYADRMVADIPILNDPKTIAATSSFWQKQKAGIPLIGNALTSSDYQTGRQAQEDFINAILRRESGAAVSNSEFDKYGKQYFPQYGDKEDVIAQKAANRERTLSGVQRSAGASYKKPLAIDGSEPVIDIAGFANPNESLQDNIPIPQKPSLQQQGAQKFTASKLTTPDTVKAAYQAGKITKDQAKELLKNKHGFSD